MSELATAFDIDSNAPDNEEPSRYGPPLPQASAASLPQASAARLSAVETIPVCRPLLPTRRRLLAYLDAIDGSRHYSNHGGLALALQERLRAKVRGAAHVALASSGTAALTGAILATAGRARPARPLCLVPAYTFIGTVSAIEQGGFTPHFVDVNPESWLLEPDACRRHPLLDQVGLVVPVAPYGRPVPQAGWEAFRAATGIPVAIDGAAAMEGFVARPDLTLGTVPVAASFHATKAFCTGEGGAVFCGDLPTWRAAVESLNFGYNCDRVSGRPSINGKMSEYHAAVGLAELESWSEKVRRYAEVAAWYREAGHGLVSQLHLPPDVASNYVLVETVSARHAHGLVAALMKAGIGCRKWYGSGVHRQPYCRDFGRDRLAHAEDLADRLVGLPMAVDLTPAEVRDVMSVVRRHDRTIPRQ